MNEIPLLQGVIMAGVFAGLVWLCWALLSYMPRWTRPDIYFSVTVQPEFRHTPEAKRIEQRYRRQVALHSLIGSGLVLSSLPALGTPALYVALLVAGLLWQTIGSMASVAAARRRVLGYAVPSAPTRDAAIQPRPTPLAGRWWWLGPPLILAVFVAYLGLRWQDIPGRFPTHWGPSGQPDAWADRGIASVFFLPAMGMTCWLMMLAIAWALGRFSRRIHARGPGATREGRFLRITQWVSLGMAYWFSLTIGTLGLLPLLVGMNSPLPMWFYVFVASELVLTTITIVILARTGQGGWRLSVNSLDEAKSPSERPVGDRTPDSAWKLGLFYYNPEDPAVFIEKRFGIGWDFNWGRPAAWLMLLTLMIVPLLVTLALYLASDSRHVEPTPNATSQAATALGSEPVVVETYPVHGAQDVDPSLQEIRIRFDQPMDQTT
ncbi:MAG: DUF1648 domain-containing protein, partial [Planctomycetes bacterium]|nr:DUF1648 domain-containing protein [Planctomycetota bacterium]